MMPEVQANFPPYAVHTPPAYVSIVAANTSTLLYTISTNSSGKIVKIMATSRAGGGFLRIGYLNAAAAFVQVLPDIQLLANIDMELPEELLPAYWFRETGYALANIYAQCSVGGADPADVQVMIEVVEKGL